MRFLRGIKGVTLMEMLVATSLSGVLVMGAGSMAMMSDKMLKAIESDPSLDAFFGVERLSRAVSRARYITSSGTDVFKARLDYDFTNGIWRPRHTPSDPSDDTWIAAKWIPSMKAVYLAYPTGAGEPPDPTSAGIQLTTSPVTGCAFTLEGPDAKILKMALTVGTDPAREIEREILASEMP